VHKNCKVRLCKSSGKAKKRACGAAGEKWMGKQILQINTFFALTKLQIIL
jgi:hypothetical protein